MRAVFVAHGPFSSGAKAIATRGVSLQAGSSHIAPVNARANANAWHSITDEAHIMQGFPNVEIYNLVMRLLGISRLSAQTNGTVGFWDNYLEL